METQEQVVLKNNYDLITKEFQRKPVKFIYLPDALKVFFPIREIALTINDRKYGDLARYLFEKHKSLLKKTRFFIQVYPDKNQTYVLDQSGVAELRDAVSSVYPYLGSFLEWAETTMRDIEESQGLTDTTLTFEEVDARKALRKILNDKVAVLGHHVSKSGKSSGLNPWASLNIDIEKRWGSRPYMSSEKLREAIAYVDLQLSEFSTTVVENNQSGGKETEEVQDTGVDLLSYLNFDGNNVDGHVDLEDSSVNTVLEKVKTGSNGALTTPTQKRVSWLGRDKFLNFFFGRRRRHLALSFEQLAKMAQVEVSLIQDLTSGSVPMRINSETVDRLAKSLKMPASLLDLMLHLHANPDYHYSDLSEEARVFTIRFYRSLDKKEKSMVLDYLKIPPYSMSKWTITLESRGNDFGSHTLFFDMYSPLGDPTVNREDTVDDQQGSEYPQAAYNQDYKSLPDHIWLERYEILKKADSLIHDDAARQQYLDSLGIDKLTVRYWRTNFRNHKQEFLKAHGLEIPGLVRENQPQPAPKALPVAHAPNVNPSVSNSVDLNTLLQMKQILESSNPDDAYELDAESVLSLIDVVLTATQREQELVTKIQSLEQQIECSRVRGQTLKLLLK